VTFVIRNCLVLLKLKQCDRPNLSVIWSEDCKVVIVMKEFPCNFLLRFFKNQHNHNFFLQCHNFGYCRNFILRSFYDVLKIWPLSCIIVVNVSLIFYHINLFNFMQGCGLTTRIKVKFDLI